MTSSRLYHSAAATLPNCKVISSGGEFGWLWGPLPGGRSWDFQVFVPPYLNNAEPRLSVVSVPTGPIQFLNSQMPATFRVYFQTLDGILPSKVVLLAPASTTHHSDMRQRFVELVVQGTGSDAGGTYIDVYPPLRTGDNTLPIGSHAVPGYYMLFLLKDVPSQTWLGVPSDAAWVQFQ